MESAPRGIFLLIRTSIKAWWSATIKPWCRVCSKDCIKNGDGPKKRHMRLNVASGIRDDPSWDEESSFTWDMFFAPAREATIFAIHFMLAAFRRMTERRLQVYQHKLTKGGLVQYECVHTADCSQGDPPDIYLLKRNHYKLLSRDAFKDDQQPQSNITRETESEGDKPPRKMRTLQGPLRPARTVGPHDTKYGAAPPCISCLHCLWVHL